MVRIGERMTETKRFLIGDAGELIDLNNHKFIDYGDECCKLLNELSDENEQLKQQLNRLYNYFEDWYHDMTYANDFSEILDDVKEDERWDDVE